METNKGIDMFILRFSSLLFFVVAASLNLATAQQLSNSAVSKIKRSQRIVDGSMAIKVSGGVYSFNAQFKHSSFIADEEVILGHLPYIFMNNLDYSDPHEGLDHGGPINRMTYELSVDKIVIKIYDRVQLICAFDDYGTEKAPEDPFTNYLRCKSGIQETIDGIMLFKNGYRIQTKVVTNCSHSKVHKKYSGGVGTSIQNGQIKKHNIINHYAPWQFTHNQTITYDLNKIAQERNITKKQLVYDIIDNELVGIGTNKGNIYNDLSSTEQYHLIYSLWSLFGNSADLNSSNKEANSSPHILSRDNMMRKANRYFDEAKSAVDSVAQDEEKFRKKAIVLLDSALVIYKEALEWCGNTQQEVDTYQQYMSAFRTQTFNAYRLKNTSNENKEVFDRNYSYFSDDVRYNAPNEWRSLLYGLGLISLELEDFNGAIVYFNNLLDEIGKESSSNLEVTNIIRIQLVKSYIGAGNIQDAKKLNDYILEKQPDNKEAQSINQQFASK